MEISFLVESEELEISLERYLKFVCEINEKFYYGRFGDPTSILRNKEMLDADLWIIEAFNPDDVTNPEGFRTAKKFAEKKKVLLFFISVPQNFPEEGSFWMKLPSKILISEKVNKVLSNPLPKLRDFENLESLWPILKNRPFHHHR